MCFNNELRSAKLISEAIRELYANQKDTQKRSGMDRAGQAPEWEAKPGSGTSQTPYLFCLFLSGFDVERWRLGWRLSEFQLPGIRYETD